MLTQWHNAAVTTQVCQTSWNPNVDGHGFGRPRAKMIAPAV